MRFRVTLEGRLASESGEYGDPVFRALDLFMDEICGSNAMSPGVQFDAATQFVSFTVNVDAAGPAGAISAASGQIRSALHAAGFGTPDWPAADDADWRVEFVSTMSPQVELVAA